MTLFKIPFNSKFENVMIVFPDIELKDWERREILAEVIGLAVQAMFENHFYEFGGKKFHQAQGGPIGLRGTCAIARVILQLFDIKWKDRLREIKIITWLINYEICGRFQGHPPTNQGRVEVGGEQSQVFQEVGERG